MATKTFANSFGRDIELTRDEYIDRWLEPTWQFGTLINTNEDREAFQQFQNTVKRSAGNKWDKSE